MLEKKDKQTQILVVDLPSPLSVENIQLKLKQMRKTKGKCIRGCYLLPGGRMVLSCYKTNTVSFIGKEEVDLFQI